MYPMRCVPALKQTIWGGCRLKTELGKQYCEPTMAESWELSCHADGMSGIANGAYAGRLLKDVLNEHPQLAGECVNRGEEFPLLVKFIDANDDLSIQVHPTPETADASRNQQSKTEIWVVLQSCPGSYLYFGFNRDVTREEIRQKALDGTICEILNKIPVQPGDVFHIHSGIMHAIGSGLLIAEIQQSANTTFRAFDFMRKDASGKMRDLHIDEAARVATIWKTQAKPADVRMICDNKAYAHEMIFDSPLFCTEGYTIRSAAAFNADKRSFEALLFVDGSGVIQHAGQSYDAKKGDCYFIGANLGAYEIQGTCRVLRNRVLRNEGRQ